MKTIEELRDEINTIDEKILSLIGKRLTLVKEVGELKKRQNKQILDSKREQEILNRLSSKAKSHFVEENLVKKIWHTIFEEAYKIEK